MLDLLLTDVVMPMMSGVQLAERVRQLRQGIRCSTCPATRARVSTAQPRSREFTEFLQKPFTRQAMLSKVASVLGSD